MAHDHGASRRVTRHSIGHLRRNEISQVKTERRVYPPCARFSRCFREWNSCDAINQGRLSRALRANDGNAGKINIDVKPFGCWLDRLCVRFQRYLPNVTESVDKTQLIASELVGMATDDGIVIDLSGRRRGLGHVWDRHG